MPLAKMPRGGRVGSRAVVPLAKGDGAVTVVLQNLGGEGAALGLRASLTQTRGHR